MHTIYSASYGNKFNVKKAISDTIFKATDESKELDEQDFILLSELTIRVEKEEIPSFSFISEKIELLVNIVKYEGERNDCSVGEEIIEGVEMLYVLKIRMPCQKDFKCSRSKSGKCECCLVWMPWPKQIQFPTSTGKTGGYHDIRLFNKMLTQPRETTVWGKPYTFSGATHEVEPGDVPSDIYELFRTTERLMKLQEGSVNMCLKNFYNHKRHCIGEHSDDDKEMGILRDVFCWCVGSGELVLRARKNCSELNGGDKTKQTPKEREILRCIIPTGLYVMEGKCFQKEYTHEFPEQFQSFYKKLSELVNSDTAKFSDFPRDAVVSDKGANRTHLLQADWIAANHERVAAKVEGKDKTTFEYWRQPRTSYTLRGFRDNAKDAKDNGKNEEKNEMVLESATKKQKK